ncbi:MAG TPA: ATP-binding protein [Patescibacteria group bacterium]|nr:ATP-binding protein [Patescibacteria group bacterium]
MPKAIHKTSVPKPNDHIAALEHERLISLINSMADAVIAVDEHQVVAIYNGAALNILDLNIELRGKKLHSLIKLIDKNEQLVDIEKLINRTLTQFTTRDLLLKYPNNETINLYLSVAPVHLGFGVSGARGHVLLLRDITHEKSLEEERDEFISVVSHELRTPIAIAEGNISNAQFVVDKNKDVPEVIKQSLKAAYDQTIFLSGMINDLATLSRAERGKLNVEVESINSNELLKDLEQNYAPQAKAKGLKLMIDVDPELQLLQSSKLYTKEILQNFITNAIKYTEKGKVIISARPKSNGVMFEVSDTGIGISKADKQKVFGKFFRSEDYRTRQSTGTGLGLYVTKKLASLIHAEISLETELNHGSTFSIFIPSID